MQNGVVQGPETLYQIFLPTSSTQYAISRCWAAGACLGRYATTCLVDATYSVHPCPLPPPLPFPPALPLGPWPAFPSPCPPTLLRALSPSPPPPPACSNRRTPSATAQSATARSRASSMHAASLTRTWGASRSTASTRHYWRGRCRTAAICSRRRPLHHPLQLDQRPKPAP